ncbi:MAG: hypothetical protein H6708_21725 [Kofleriaceae bacterium]|nr:hypothetical protein [Myxococcales bacterium]MCB9563034.1 hypothetical protein [Kofleriaceae bacterium]
MRTLRNVMLAIGLAALATACGGKSKTDSTMGGGDMSNSGGDMSSGGGDSYGGDMYGGDMGDPCGGGDMGMDPCEGGE